MGGFTGFCLLSHWFLGSVQHHWYWTVQYGRVVQSRALNTPGGACQRGSLIRMQLVPQGRGQRCASFGSVDHLASIHWLVQRHRDVLSSELFRLALLLHPTKDHLNLWL
eukprot:PhF_6_TR27151/c0_g1_i1/m.39660